MYFTIGCAIIYNTEILISHKYNYCLFLNKQLLIMATYFSLIPYRSVSLLKIFKIIHAVADIRFHRFLKSFYMVAKLIKNNLIAPYGKLYHSLGNTLPLFHLLRLEFIKSNI